MSGSFVFQNTPLYISLPCHIPPQSSQPLTQPLKPSRANMSGDAGTPINTPQNPHFAPVPAVGRPPIPYHSSRAMHLAVWFWQGPFPQVGYLNLTFPIMIHLNNALHPVIITVAEDYEGLCHDLQCMFSIQARISLRIWFAGPRNRLLWCYLDRHNILSMLNLMRTRVGVDSLVVEVL